MQTFARDQGEGSRGTGIYHVMLRGINRQDIFDDTEDYWTFIKMMSAVPCYIYAYCLMPNHVHLLIAEKSLKVGEVVKSIASCYVPYYNKKYGRIGHLLQEFQLHTKDRQKDIVRDVMRELGAGPRQMVRVCGLTYAVVYKMWKDL